MSDRSDDQVSRRRYEREKQARREAESLLEQKSRELFLANQQLAQNSARLEQAVEERTADLQKALEMAEEASTARSRFIATMSHEIRTPLGGLLGMIDLLAMDEDDPRKLELLNYAKAAGGGLRRIVNDVLDFSKMEAGVFVFEEESVDIRALIESIRVLAGSQPHGANRRILAQIDDRVPKLFVGDATRFRQVISNLVNNALRFSNDGPVIVRVTASDHAAGALLRVEVEDFGVGIAESDLENLFKDFTQIANPLTAAAQGTGLGLAICKRIVDGIGGTISVDSRPGDGTTFWFEVPVSVVSDPDAEGRDGHPQIFEGKGIAGGRVLLAEDNLVNQKLLLTYLHRMQLVTDLAENGRIALEKFAPGKYDLVLMDVAMPEMDGLEATHRIREKWGDAQLPPIIALTAHVMDAVANDAKLVGIDCVLSKPIPYDELKRSIELAMSGRASPATSARHALETPLRTSPVPKAAAGTLLDLIAPETAADLLEIFTPAALSDLAAKFVSDANTRLARLLEANAAGDQHVVTEQAHSLKGAASLLGLADMRDLARRIERNEADRDGASVAETAALFKARLQEIERVLKPDT